MSKVVYDINNSLHIALDLTFIHFSRPARVSTRHRLSLERAPFTRDVVTLAPSISEKPVTRYPYATQQKDLHDALITDHTPTPPLPSYVIPQSVRESTNLQHYAIIYLDWPTVRYNDISSKNCNT